MKEGTASESCEDCRERLCPQACPEQAVGSRRERPPPFSVPWLSAHLRKRSEDQNRKNPSSLFQESLGWLGAPGSVLRRCEVQSKGPQSQSEFLCRAEAGIEHQRFTSSLQLRGRTSPIISHTVNTATCPYFLWGSREAVSRDATVG